MCIFLTKLIGPILIVFAMLLSIFLGWVLLYAGNFTGNMFNVL